MSRRLFFFVTTCAAAVPPWFLPYLFDIAGERHRRQIPWAPHHGAALQPANMQCGWERMGGTAAAAHDPPPSTGTHSSGTARHPWYPYPPSQWPPLGFPVDEPSPTPLVLENGSLPSAACPRPARSPTANRDPPTPQPLPCPCLRPHAPGIYGKSFGGYPPPPPPAGIAKNNI